MEFDMAVKGPKVLYFVAGSRPSNDDMEAGAKMGPGVFYRNANFIQPEIPLEACDYVAGPAIPANYREAFPKFRMKKEKPEEPTEEPPANPSSWKSGEPK